MYVLNLCPDNLQGSLPTKLGSLSCLGIFQLYGNNPSGTIPPLIYNIFSIYNFSVTQNQLHGSLPLDVGLTLSNLQTFASNVNNFTGIVPVSLSNASQLQLLDFAQNGATGTMPQNLNFDNNRLGNGKDGVLNFLNFLANCTILEEYCRTP